MSRVPTRVLACDLGKSACRVALVVDGVRTRETERVGTTGLADPRGAADAVAAIAAAAAELTDDPVDAVAAGLAGMAQAPAAAGDLAARLRRQHHDADVVLASDMTTSHLGALGGEPGVVVAAGTGAVALAVSPSGAHRRVDGWGYLLGDAGSGHDIARQGLDAALREHDGRGGSPRLRALAEQRYGDLDRLPRTVHGSANPVRTIAAFAPDVLRAAEDGDTVSQQLWTQAGRALAATTAAAAAVVSGGGAVAVSTTGGLFSAGRLLSEPFTAELARLLPTAQLHPPVGDAIDGAHLMATRHDLPHGDLLVRPEGGAR